MHTRVFAMAICLAASAATSGGCATANTGEAELRAPRQPIRVWKDCHTTIGIVHRIVTHDTPRARDLHGKLTLKATAGDPAVIRLARLQLSSFLWLPFLFVRPYTLGTPIAVVEPGHVGGGEHTWHEGVEHFTIWGRKDGRVTLEAAVDPDPEVPEGDGRPTKRATFEVIVPTATSIRIADARWNDIDEKTVTLRSDGLRLKVEVNTPLADIEEAPCRLRVKMLGSRIPSEGTNSAGASVPLALANLALAPGGTTVRIHLTPADMVRHNLVPPAPQDAAAEFSTADYIAASPPGSNRNDSDGFDLDSARAGNRPRGMARSFETGTDGNMSAQPPEASTNLSYLKAGGVELVQVDLNGAKSELRWYQNQADTLYYSGHGYHVPASVAVVGGRFGPAEATAAWNHELKKVFFAGCSILDIKNYNSNNFGNAASNAASPGEKWLTAGPTRLFGYLFKAPLDNQGGDPDHSKRIVQQYFANRAAGMNENWSWGSANQTVAAGNYHTAAKGRAMNCCMIDLTVSPTEYWYFAVTWGGMFGGTPSYAWTKRIPPW